MRFVVFAARQVLEPALAALTTDFERQFLQRGIQTLRAAYRAKNYRMLPNRTFSGTDGSSST